MTINAVALPPPKRLLLKVDQVKWTRRFTAKFGDQKKPLNGQTFDELMDDTSAKFGFLRKDFNLTTVISAKGEKRECKLTRKIFDELLPKMPSGVILLNVKLVQKRGRSVDPHQ